MDAPVQSYLDKLILKRAAKPKPTVVLPANVELTDARSTVQINRQLVMQRSARYFSVVSNARKMGQTESTPEENQYINPPRIADLAVSKQPFEPAKPDTVAESPVAEPEPSHSVEKMAPSVPSSLEDDSLNTIEYPTDKSSKETTEKSGEEEQPKEKEKPKAEETPTGEKSATILESIFGTSESKPSSEDESPKPDTLPGQQDALKDQQEALKDQPEALKDQPEAPTGHSEELVKEEDLEQESTKKRAGPRPRKIADKTVVSGIDISGVEINDTLLTVRLPSPEKLVVKTSHYYMTNRKLYIQKLAELFVGYNTEIASTREEASCDSRQGDTGPQQLMVHQRIVRDYLNLFTPYRGLLLYHGLGSGKTASSIAIAEGMKSHKKIFILTPASLKMNFFSELKRYGDPLYKKNQFWEFVSTVGNPEYEDILSQVLSLPREYVVKNKGAWLVDVSKTDSNFNELDAAQQKSLDDQLNHMIRTKYIDINYNGLTADKVDRLVAEHGANPFDHSVVLIDEAHNLMSRIVNKLNKPKSLSMRLYQFFLNAQDARFVMMSGTPIINYPNELAVLYNVLRGYIKTWTFTVKPPPGFTSEQLPKLFDQENFRLYDFMDYSNGKLVITRNPFGFTYEKHPGPEKGSKHHPHPTLKHIEKTHNLGEKQKIRVVPGNNPVVGEPVVSEPVVGEPVVVGKPVVGEPVSKEPQKSIFEILGFTSTKEPAEVPKDVPKEQQEALEGKQEALAGEQEIAVGKQKDIAGEQDATVGKQDATVGKQDATVGKQDATVGKQDATVGKQEAVPSQQPTKRRITIKKPILGGRLAGKTRKCTVAKTTVIAIDMKLSPEPTPLTSVEANKTDYYEVVDGIIQLKYPIVNDAPIPETNPEIERELEMDYLTHYDGADEIHGGDTQLGGAPIIYNRYNGIHLTESGDVSDDDFQQEIIRILKKYGFTVDINVSVVPHKCLPDSRDEFAKMFVDNETKTMRNVPLFKKRILGLTSYFRSAQETLLPSYVKNDKDGIYHIVSCAMSEYQLGEYDEIREVEREKESKLAMRRKKMQNKPNADNKELESTYRIFSRLACNFVFPPSLPRPLPLNAESIDAILENETGADITMDAVIDNRLGEMEDQPELPEDKTAPELSATYAQQLAKAMVRLKTEISTNATTATGELRDVEVLSRDGLAIYSPKMGAILDNLRDEENKGLHLLYSNFRTLEGIGIMKLVLEKNGFAEFRVRKMSNGEWRIVDADEDKSKPRFVLYTGTETAEEREVIRNVYNSNWDALPSGLSQSLRKQAQNNYYGEIVRILMITASGAEGINLENTRFVHIVEPYWHLVRIEQVVGRARRICSHKHLPPELRTVKVFLYISTYTDAHRKSNKYLNLMTKDTGSQGTPITTDQYLYEMASLKDNLNGQLLKCVKETAIDCSLYSKNHQAEGLVCYGFGKVSSNDFGTFPTLEEDQMQVEDINLQTIKFKPKKIEIPGQGVFVYNPDTREAYDYAVYDNSRQFVLIGKITGEGNNRRFEPTQKQ